MSTERKYKADPGIGRDDAPIGSESWAQSVRLHLQVIVKDIDSEPKRVRRYINLIAEHRAWTLMNRPDGSYFATWEEFCEHPQPWGLGKPWEDIKPFLEAAEGKRAVQLATVAPAQAANQHTAKAASYPEDTKHTAPAHERRLRAIAERAPAPVRDLFRADLIGAKEAAALGPKNPTQDEALRVAAVALEASRVVEEHKPTTPAEKRATKRKVNDAVRSSLGRTVDPVKAALLAIAKVPTERLGEIVEAIQSRLAGEAS